LEETYNLKGLTPRTPFSPCQRGLEETYNLKGLTPEKYFLLNQIQVGRDL